MPALRNPGLATEVRRPPLLRTPIRTAGPEILRRREEILKQLNLGEH